MSDSTPTDAEIDSPANTQTQTQGRFWPQFRRFLIFQVKLYIDALRDFVLSFLSFWAFLLDVITQSHGKGSHFERVLKLGRRSERAINLFEQYDPEQQEKGVDAMIRRMEGRFGKPRDTETQDEKTRE